MTNTPAGSIKAWAPSSSPPKAASLFCGAGGACLGLRQAGYDVIAGVDFDPLALATYATAGGHAVQHMITEEAPVPPEWVEPMTGLDLLWASPPCQPWSRAGKMKGAEDERDAWPATIAAVALLKPRWFVAENVRGVEQHLDGYVIPAMKRLGYVVGWRCLNAADYGIPQTRQRVILAAGPERFMWPMATHGDPKKLRPLFDARKPWRSMGEALGLEANPHPAATIRAGGSVDHTGKMGGGPTMLVYDPKHAPSEPERPAPTIRSCGSGHSAPTLNVMTAGETGEGRPQGMGLPYATLETKGAAYLLNLPSPCVTASEVKGASGPHHAKPRENPISRASDALKMATGRRRLTTAECAILQDFPADYPWQGGITATYRQIGNAVPPTLSRVVAMAIKNHLTRAPIQESP